MTAYKKKNSPAMQGALPVPEPEVDDVEDDEDVDDEDDE